MATYKDQMVHWPAFSVLSVMAFFVSANAYADRISIDFTGPDSFGSSSGLAMPNPTPDCALDALNGGRNTSCSLNLVGNLSAEVAIGFNIMIGGSTYSTLFINENGLVTFGAAGPAGAPTAGTFAALQTQLGTTPFITPAYTDLATGNGTPFDIAGGGPGILYQRGLGIVGAGPYVPSDPRGTSAFNVVWASDTVSGPFASQLILYSLDAGGGFAARFNYGTFSSDNPLVGAFGGYSLGSLSTTFGEPIDLAVDRTYLFPGATSVPEPGTMALLGMGLLGLIGSRRRRIR